MVRRFVVGLSLMMVSAMAVACGDSSPSTSGEGNEEADFTSGKKVERTAKSFAGTFSVDMDGDLVRMKFDMKDIDWDARTAAFSSKIVEGEHDGLTEDQNVPVTIKVARCPGCYSFEIVQDGDTMLRLDFEKSVLKRLEYSGFVGTKATVTAVSAGAVNGGHPEGYGDDCGGFAGLTCREGLRCDNSRGLNTGYCR